MWNTIDCMCNVVAKCTTPDSIFYICNLGFESIHTKGYQQFSSMHSCETDLKSDYSSGVCTNKKKPKKLRESEKHQRRATHLEA